jgi:hypothetical protein
MDVRVRERPASGRRGPRGPRGAGEASSPWAGWPRHQKQWWNEALGEARAAGWTLNHIDAPHRFGIASCPGEDDDARHSFMIDKTARGGETKSKEARKLIRVCHHAAAATGSKVRQRQEECERLLDEADRLISIADEGLTLAEAYAVAWTDLERLETQLETAAANLVEALREEQDEAWQAVQEVSVPAPDTIGDGRGRRRGGRQGRRGVPGAVLGQRGAGTDLGRGGRRVGRRPYGHGTEHGRRRGRGADCCVAAQAVPRG